MRYVFYADIFWLNQFLLQTAILLLAGQLHGPPGPARSIQHKGCHDAQAARSKQHTQYHDTQAARSRRHKRHGKLQPAFFRQYAKCIGSAALGSTLGTAILLLTQSYYGYLAAEYLAILPLMTLLAFGRCDLRVFLTRCAGCFGTAILLGGLTTALENSAGIAQIPFLSVLIAFLIAAKWIPSLLRHRQVHSLLTPVILRHCDRSTQLTGFIDTGNLLHEPYGGKAVHLLRASVMEASDITEEAFAGLVPYQALGSSEGLLELYRVDALGIPADTNTLETDAATITLAPASASNAPAQPSDPAMPKTDARTGTITWICPVIVAKAPDELFYGKEYDLILNSDIIS